MAPSKSLLKDLIVITVLIKVTSFVIIYLAANLLPFCYQCYIGDFSHLPIYPWSPWLSLSTWDARHYMYLADMGYSAGLPSNVFYPLFPLLIGLLKVVLFIPSTLLAGLFTANVISVGAVMVFFLLVRHLFGEKIAFYSALFLLAFPTGFYLHLIYTEGLFLLLISSFFLFWEKKKWGLAAVIGLLLPWSRPLGVLMLVPVCIEGLCEYLEKRNHVDTFKNYGLLCVSLLSGFAVYLLFMYWQTGSAWAGFEEQVHFIGNNSIHNLFHLGDWFFRNFIDIDFALHGFTNSVLDRFFFLGYLTTLLPIRTYVGRKYFVFALVMGLVPAFAGVFMGYLRYLLVVFPCFIVLARAIKDKTPYVVFPMLMIQIVFLVIMVLNYWVA